MISCTVWICHRYWHIEFTWCLTVRNFSWVIHCYYWCSFICWEVRYCHFAFHFTFSCTLTKWFFNRFHCWFISVRIFRSDCYFNFHNIRCFIWISHCDWNFELAACFTVRYFCCIHCDYRLVALFREIRNTYFTFDFIFSSCCAIWFCDFSRSRFIFIILRLRINCKFHYHMVFCTIWISDCDWHFKLTACFTVRNFCFIYCHCEWLDVFWISWNSNFSFYFIRCCCFTIMFSYLSCFRIVFHIIWLIAYSNFNYYMVFCTIWISDCNRHIKYPMSISIR
ncbi:Uncharacterised protein [Staphylococcus simulans]|uniref:Uncharacterized protein n=1 Tax=Staphylococcus simulans TaxID=1286 RepID=A0A6N3DMZ8_STASI